MCHVQDILNAADSHVYQAETLDPLHAWLPLTHAMKAVSDDCMKATMQRIFMQMNEREHPPQQLHTFMD
jgi:hypothetical protein